jgi:uncharacterized protein (TIGR03435 family)
MSATGVPATRAQSQSQNAAPAKYEYDVVSIKIIPPDNNSIVPGVGFTPYGFTANGVRLWWLFRMAYDMPRSQIVGAPDWVDDTWLTMEGRLDPATAEEMQKLSPDQLRSARQQMLRALMADRFGLKFHIETRELPAYILTVGKDGPKLQDAKPDYVGKLNQTDVNGKRQMDFVIIAYENQQSFLVGQAASMTTLAGYLSQWALAASGQTVKPILDKTGLTGRYDFSFKFSTQNTIGFSSPTDPAGAPPTTMMVNSEGPSLFKALQDNLGLKLESGKGPVPVIVIDHVEKPSAN